MTMCFTDGGPNNRDSIYIFVAGHIVCQTSFGTSNKWNTSCLVSTYLGDLSGSGVKCMPASIYVVVAKRENVNEELCLIPEEFYTANI